ncbi:uncharacterized protein [Oscarella lobularis]|uniref:uncharacterized protein isoform X2 n=1 Tax=Oscarella lobularis TaxID=121494 RepID=UPI003313E265
MDVQSPAGGVLQHERRQSMNSRRSFTSSALSEEMELDTQIRHGVVPGERLRVDNVIRQVVFHRPRNVLVALDGRGIQIWNARRNSTRIPFSVDLCGVVYASKSNQYVGYRGTKLKLFDHQFHIIFETSFSTEISCAVYNDLTNEIVTCGQGNVTCWMFRRGSKIIVPRTEISGGMRLNEKLCCLHLEKVASRSQRSFVVSGSAVHVHNLHEAKHLKTYRELHARPITSLLFWPALGAIFTGAKDGSVKVWNEEFRLQRVFAGHKKSVSSLVMHPYGRRLITGSEDTTIRVWCLDTGDEIEKLETMHPVNGLAVHPNHKCFYSYSSNCIDTWIINQLHSFLAKLGSPVKKLLNTNHPRVPRRLLALCDNGAMHVLSPASGDIISTALLPISESVRDLAYAPQTDDLFGLCDSGKVFAFSTKTHPSRRVGLLETESNIGRLVCLFMYEYTMDEEMLQEAIARDKWLGVALQAQGGRDVGTPQDRTLLLGGTTFGLLVWLDSKSGKTSSSVKAHEGEISAMTANSNRDVVVTFGNDKILRVWRLYPFSADPFSPLLTFYCPQVSSHMAIVRESLFAVFQNPSSASYAVTAFNLAKKSRAFHDPDEDHNDAVLALSCCEKIHIFATCSVDGTVRVWNDEGKLLREIQLNAIPEAVAFSSARGSLVVSIEGQLYNIDFRKFLPKSYLQRMVSMRFASVPFERTRDLILDQFPDQTDRTRLVPVRTTPSVDRSSPFSDVPSHLESDEYRQEMKTKEMMMALLSERNEEITRIRDGDFARERGKLKVSLSNKMKEKTWRDYYDIVGPDFVSVEFDPDEEFDRDAYRTDLDSRTESEEPFQRPSSPDRFFPPLAKHEPPYSIAPDCHIPNSIILKDFLKGQDIEEMRSRWKPRDLSAEQLALLAKKRADAENENVVEDEDDENDGAVGESDFMDRLRAALDENPEPEEPSPEPTPPATPPPKARLPPVSSQKKVVKFVAPKPKTPSPPPPPPTPPKDPTPPPRKPTPSRTPTPPSRPQPTVPQFIEQFMSHSWFESLFPGVSITDFPMPWTVSHFVELLSQGLRRSSDLAMKTDIVKALHILYQQEGFSNKSIVIGSLSSQLRGDIAFNSAVEEEKLFILECLRLLFGIDAVDAFFVVELIVQFIDGDEEMREVVATYFLSMGLDDQNQYFIPKELDSWDIWNLEEENRKSRLTAMASDWFQRWCGHYNRHLVGQLQGNAAIRSIQGRRGGMVSPRKKQTKASERMKSIDESTAESVKPIDVINYFVRIEHEKELEKLRAMQSRTEAEATAEEPKKNTILTLPRIPKTSLARLGETHCSKCHPERETSLAISALVFLSSKCNREMPFLHRFCRDLLAAFHWLCDPTSFSRLLKRRRRIQKTSIQVA